MPIEKKTPEQQQQQQGDDGEGGEDGGIVLFNNLQNQDDDPTSEEDGGGLEGPLSFILDECPFGPGVMAVLKSMSRGEQCEAWMDPKHGPGETNVHPRVCTYAVALMYSIIREQNKTNLDTKTHPNIMSFSS